MTDIQAVLLFFAFIALLMVVYAGYVLWMLTKELK